MKRIIISLLIALMLCTVMAPSASAQLPIPPDQATWPPDQQLLYVTFVAHFQRDLALTTDYIVIRCIDINPDSYWMGCEYSYMIEKQNQWTLPAQLPPSTYTVFLDRAPKSVLDTWESFTFEVGAMQNMMVEFDVGNPDIPSDATPTPLGGLIIPTPTPNPANITPDPNASETPSSVEITKVPSLTTPSASITPSPTDTATTPTTTPTPSNNSGSSLHLLIIFGVCTVAMIAWVVYYKIKHKQ